MHLELFFIFFFSLISIWCVSMQSVLRVIFDKQLRYFLSRKGYTALFDSVWNRIYVKFLNAKTRKTFRIICVRICVHECIYWNLNLIWGWRIGFVFSFNIVCYYYVSISLSQKQLLASGASWEKKSILSFMKYITVIMRFTRVTRRRLYHFG